MPAARRRPRTTPPPGHAPARRGLAALVVAVLALLATFVPTTAATAAGEVVGGTSRGSAVPLPIRDLDSQVVVGNLNATTRSAWNLVSWYSWRATTTQVVYMRATSIEPRGWDNTLEVWEGGQMLAQNDDSYGLDAALRLELQAGRTYQIGLGAYRPDGRGTAQLTFSTRPPTAPLDVRATSQDGGVRVAWTAPQDLAGGVTRYDVTCSVDGAAAYDCASVSGTPPRTDVVVPDLANGVPVTVTVTASNVIGPSPASAPATATPQAPSSTTVTFAPAQPVSGEPFDVRVAVAATPGTPVTGTVDLVVGGTAMAGLPLVDGVAVVPGLVAPAGPYTASAAYSGSAAVAASSSATSVSVARRGQTVALDALPEGLVYAGTPVDLVASASSGGPVVLTATGACVVDGARLSFTDVGTCTVTAAQEGDSETLPASASVTAEVGQRPQTLTFPELPTLVYDQERLPLVATSDVELPVLLTAEGACALDEAGALATTGVGPCTVTAAQAGDERTVAAASVVRTTEVVRRADVVTFDEVEVPALGTPTPVTAGSLVGLPVALSAEGACVLEDGVLRAVATGDCVVTATTEGDELTEPASASVTVVVAEVPAVVRAALSAELGTPAAGADVFARGAGLRPGTAFTLTVFSTPRVLATGEVDVDGTAVLAGVLPDDLELGAHRLVATGTGLGGEDVASEVAFRVGPEGLLVQIGDRVLAPVTVPAAPAPAVAAPAAPAAAPAATAPAALAATGGGVGGLLQHAVLALLLGLSAVLAVRFRPTH